MQCLFVSSAQSMTFTSPTTTIATPTRFTTYSTWYFVRLERSAEATIVGSTSARRAGVGSRGSFFAMSSAIRTATPTEAGEQRGEDIELDDRGGGRPTA